MPNVPALEAPDVQQEPLPGRAYPRFSEESSEAAFGAPIAQGLQHLSEEGVRWRVQDDNMRVLDAHTQLEAGRDALLYGNDGQGGVNALKGVDAVDLPNKYLPQYDQLANKISSTLTPQQQTLFQRSIATGRQQFGLMLERREFQEHQLLQNEIYKNGVEQAVDSAAAHYADPVQVGTSRANLKAIMQMRGDAEGWTPAIREQQTQDAMARLDAGVIDAMLGDKRADQAKAFFDEHRGEFSPKVVKQVEKAIDAGRLSQANDSITAAYNQSTTAGEAAMSAFMKREDIPADDRAKVAGMVNRSRIELAEAKQQDPATQKQLNWLDDQIAGGNVSPGALGTAAALHERGALTDQQYRVTRNEIIRASKKDDAENLELAYIDQQFKSGTPIQDVESHEKGLSLYLAMTTMGQRPGSDRWNQQVVDMSRQLGAVPKTVGHYVLSALGGGSPQEAAQAARTMELVRDANGVAYMQAFDHKTQSMGRIVNDAVNAGVDPDKAVEFAREQTDMDQGKRAILDEQWKTEKPKGTTWGVTDQESISRALAGDPNYTTPGRFFGRKSDVPAIPAGMQADYQAALKDYFYNNGGNYVLAGSQAMDAVKGVWGVYEHGGTRELVKYAPSRMIPGMTDAAIREDLRSEGHGDAKLSEIPGITGTSGGRIWYLREPDAHGSFDFVKGDDGRPVQYQVPTPKVDTAKRDMDEANETLREFVKQHREEKTAEAAQTVLVPRL